MNGTYVSPCIFACQQNSTFSCHPRADTRCAAHRVPAALCNWGDAGVRCWEQHRPHHTCRDQRRGGKVGQGLLWGGEADAGRHAETVAPSSRCRRGGAGHGELVTFNFLHTQRFVSTDARTPLYCFPAGSDAAGFLAGLPAEGAAAGEGGEEAAAEPASKRARKGRRGRGKADENANPSATEGEAACKGGSRGRMQEMDGAGAELVLAVENRTPMKETYQFSQVRQDVHGHSRAHRATSHANKMGAQRCSLADAQAAVPL